MVADHPPRVCCGWLDARGHRGVRSVHGADSVRCVRHAITFSGAGVAPTTQYVACWGQYFGVTCWSQLRFLRGLGGLGYRQLGLAIWGLRSLGGSRHARRFQRCVALTEGINQLDDAPYPACLGGRASGRAVGSKNTACSMRSGLFLEGNQSGWLG